MTSFDDEFLMASANRSSPANRSMPPSASGESCRSAAYSVCELVGIAGSSASHFFACSGFLVGRASASSGSACTVTACADGPDDRKSSMRNPNSREATPIISAQVEALYNLFMRATGWPQNLRFSVKSRT